MRFPASVLNTSASACQLVVFSSSPSGDPLHICRGPPGGIFRDNAHRSDRLISTNIRSLHDTNAASAILSFNMICVLTPRRVVFRKGLDSYLISFDHILWNSHDHLAPPHLGLWTDVRSDWDYVKLSKFSPILSRLSVPNEPFQALFAEKDEA